MSEEHGSEVETNIDPKPRQVVSARGGLTRRTWLGGAALFVGTGATCLMTTSASAKTSQAVAKYQDKPQGQSKCGTCAQFEAPGSCKLVDGAISENGWCQLYTPKAA